jgi:LPS O-antigen subunit length determinant protein (WzzB/FepE family)
MRKFYQKEWFGIDFESFAELDHKKIADASFYDKFYDEFYRQFSSYEELPEDWKFSKKQVADLILKQTNKNDRLPKRCKRKCQILN